MISVNGLDISDNINYLVEEVDFRNMPSRTVYNTPISRRPGDKLTGLEWSNKAITIKGRVFSTTTSGLIGLVDTLQQNLAVQSLALVLDTGRTYTVNLTDLKIPNQFYNNTMVEYQASLLATDPFAYTNQLTASGTVVSGTQTFSGSITISGTVFAEPTLTINLTNKTVGNSGVYAMKFTHTPTGETMTWSGNPLSYSSPTVIDFNNFLVTVSGVNSDYTGIFSRFEPGVVNYTITVTSGTRQGFNYTWAYQPRYYQ